MEITFSSILWSYLAHFYDQARKIKQNPPRKKFLIFQEMELSSSNIKNTIIFPQKKAFIKYLEMEPCTFQPKLKI